MRLLYDHSHPLDSCLNNVTVQAVAEVRDACTVIPVMPDTITQALAFLKPQPIEHAQFPYGKLAELGQQLGW